MALFPTNDDVRSFNNAITEKSAPQDQIVVIRAEDARHMYLFHFLKKDFFSYNKRARYWLRKGLRPTDKPKQNLKDVNVTQNVDIDGVEYTIRDEQAGGLVKNLRLFIGSRVMLRCL